MLNPFRICNIGILSIEKALMRTITIILLQSIFSFRKLPRNNTISLVVLLQFLTLSCFDRSLKLVAWIWVT